MVETVVPPYSTAYSTLNEHIVQKLLAANTESDTATIQILVKSLLRAATTIHNELQKASRASERIRSAMDIQITQLVLSISKQEERVNQSQLAVNQANINIQHTQQQIAAAEVHLRETQHALNQANDEVHKADEREKKARLCGGRRKKRFLGEIKRLAKNTRKTFNDVVRKPICNVINSGGIKRAKEARTMAEQSLTHAHHRVHAHQQTLSTQRAQHNTAQAQLNAANNELATTTLTLNEQRAKQLLVTTLTKQLKKCRNTSK